MPDKERVYETEPALAGTHQDASMKNTLAHLESMPGMNVALGLASLKGKTEKYINLLYHFIELHADDMTLLAASLADGNHATALNVAHKLKGAAAILGIDLLAELAGRLESVLRTNEAGSISCGDVTAEMAAINAELTSLAAVLPYPASRSVDPSLTDTGRLRVVLDELDSLLAQSDTAAIALFEKHAALLRTVQYNELEGQIRQFDFGSALETLRSLRQPD